MPTHSLSLRIIGVVSPFFLLAACGRPSESADNAESCRVQFSAANVTATGSELTITAPLPTSCVNFLTDNEGLTDVKLVLETANGAEICPSTVTLNGQADAATFPETCTTTSLTQAVTAPWKRPLAVSPSNVTVTLKSSGEAASAQQLISIRLEFSARN